MLYCLRKVILTIVTSSRTIILFWFRSSDLKMKFATANTGWHSVYDRACIIIKVVLISEGEDWFQGINLRQSYSAFDFLDIGVNLTSFLYLKYLLILRL